MKFQADSVECSSNADVETVFIGNEAKELALTITNCPGTLDHYFEWNDQSNSTTNAVLFSQLTGNKLEIRLTLDASKVIGESIFNIVLQCDEEELVAAAEGLKLILGNKFFVKSQSRLAKLAEKPAKDYSQIKYLNLEGKKLKALPDYVSEMFSLETAKLAQNPKLNLETVFEALRKFPIKELSFSTDEPIPESIGQLTQLETLTIDVFTKPHQIPASIGKLKHLKRLQIMGDADVVLPESFAELAQLESLNMRVNMWQMPPQFHRLVGLKDLDLSHCLLPQVPEEMAGMGKVETLMLGGRGRYDFAQMMPIIAKMPNLRRLDLALNEIPSEIGLCRQIEEIVVFGGSGPLPDELFELAELKRLIIRYRNIGEISSKIGTLASLETLVLPECEFAGLPDSIGELSRLSVLNLSENPLLTSLPESLGNLENLRELYLNDCPQLTQLPSSAKNLGNLEQVKVDNPDTLGNFPESWKSLIS